MTELGTGQHPLRVITRNSPLALIQVRELFGVYGGLCYETTEVVSYGDHHKDVSLMSNIPADFFTRELDKALLSGTHDVAVHSAKDLAYPLPAGLEVYALTEAQDKSDSLVSRSGLTLDQLPGGSRIGTSSKQRKAELLAMRPDLVVVPIRGTIEERIAQVDDHTIDALIVATCALQRLGITRTAHRLPFKTHPLQGNLAVVGPAGRDDLRQLFAPHDVRRGWGRVTLVGFGPGDPDLLTIAGDKALRAADVIYYDDLTNKALLEQYEAEKVYVGKRRGKHSKEQEEINELIYTAAIEGREVVRLKGGDPMVFAHGREEYDYLRSRLVECCIVPGVSTALAVASLTHIPLTERGVARSVSFLLGHGQQLQTPDTDTLVYYMGGNNLHTIGRKLVKAGRNEDTPVAITTAVSMPAQRTYYTCLRNLSHAVLHTSQPVIVVVGEVVRREMESTLQRMLVTGCHQVSESEARHHEVVHTPLIKLTPIDLTSWFAEVRKQKRQYDYVVFTSPHAVQFFVGQFAKSGMSMSDFGNVRVISVGPVTTRALTDRGITPSYESVTESGVGIISYFSTVGHTGKLRILMPRSDKGLRSLSSGLVAMGHEITDLPTYHNAPNLAVKRVDPRSFSKIVFGSPSGIDAFKIMYGSLPEDTLLIARGATTFNALTESEEKNEE